MTNQEKKLLAEFYGYKAMPCNRGMAWQSPYRTASDDIWGLHGKLIQPDHSELSHLDFNDSFDRSMKVLSTIEALGFQTRIGCEYVHDCFTDITQQVVFLTIKQKTEVTHANASLWNASKVIIHEKDPIKLRAINKGIVAFFQWYQSRQALSA